LEAVGSIDSAGLGLLVQLYTRVEHVDGRLKLEGLHERLTSLLHFTKLPGRPEKKNILMELPDPFGARLPLLSPVFWLALLVTFAVLVTIASRASFSFW
jgi:hypothetical protein